MNRSLFFFFILVSLGCAKRSLEHLQRSGIKVSSSKQLQALNVQKNIVIQYLGCGGLYIQQGDQAIMIDPYFSNQRFMKIGRAILLKSKIRSSPKQLQFGKRMIEDSLHVSRDEFKDRVKGIFSAHGHYDHMMDIPYIHNEWFNGRPEVYANNSSLTTCANVLRKEKVHALEEFASVRNQVGDSIEFRSGNSKIRVYPVFADHNPHTRNVKLFAGSTIKTPAHFKHHTDKTYINDWLEGQTMSFLMDFVEGDTVTFRVFLQSSSCQYPNGVPPQRLLNDKSVDLAILGIASYQFSENTYPCEFLSKLNPKHTMFIHWEDFFDKYQRPTRAVRKNDIDRFFEKILPKCQTDYFVPVPGTIIKIDR